MSASPPQQNQGLFLKNGLPSPVKNARFEEVGLAAPAREILLEGNTEYKERAEMGTGSTQDREAAF
jgi:hypothetical protein